MMKEPEESNRNDVEESQLRLMREAAETKRKDDDQLEEERKRKEELQR
jgi:hypothetical protein